MKRTLALVLTLLLFAAACGGDDEGTAGSDTGGNDQAAGTDDVLTPEIEGALPCDENLTVDEAVSYKAPEADERYKIVLMQVSLQGYYYVSIAYGAEKAAEEAGVDFEMVAASGYASPEQQLGQVEDILEEGADAIVMAPSDAFGSVPVVDMARAQDMPVINISTEVASEEVIQVMQDDYVMGQDAADRVAELVGEEGKGIIIAGPAQATWSRKRTQGFQDRVEEAYPDIEIVASKNQLVDPAEGLKSFEDAIQSDPDIDWVYAVHSYILPWNSLGQYQGEIAYVSTGLDPDSAEGLRQGGISALQGIFGVAMGYMGVGKAVEALNGADLQTYICLPTTWFTADNIDDPAAALEMFPADYQPGS